MRAIVITSTWLGFIGLIAVPHNYMPELIMAICGGKSHLREMP